MRAEDKALELLSPTLDDPFTDIFDQYVNGDGSDSSDSNKAFDYFDDLNLFEAGTSSSDSARLSPIGTTARHNQSPSQPWRKGLWCLNQTGATSPRNISPQHTTNVSLPIEPSALVNLDLLSLDSIKLPQTTFDHLSSKSPSTPPLTPSLKKTKNYTLGSKTIGRTKKSDDRRTLFRKRSISPSLMRPSSFRHNDMSFPEAWQQQFQNFNLRRQQTGFPLSPPASGRVVQQENPARLAGQYMSGGGAGMRNARAAAQNHGLGLIDIGLANQFSPPMHHSINQNGMPHTTSAAQHASIPPAPQGASSPHHAVSQAQYQPIPSWMSNTYEPPDNNFPYDLVPSVDADASAQAWWSPPSSAAQPCPPLPQDYYSPVLTAPTPQRPAHNLLQTSDLQDGGLMIQYGDQALQGELHHHMPSAQPQSHPQSHHHQQQQHYQTSALQSPPMTNSYPSISDHFGQNSPFTTPRRRPQQPPPPPQYHPSPSRSPSPLSPTNTNGLNTPHHHHQQSFTNRTARRKSQGPPEHRTPRHQKSSSAISKTPRTPKTPQTPGGGGGFSVDFVNFTPHDSRKILTGVAPSGSSKTKARREQEAREKRRRLSEAALRAVQRAGGDIAALQRAAAGGDIEALEAAILC